MAKPTITEDKLKWADLDVTHPTLGEDNKVPTPTTKENDGWDYQEEPAYNYLNYWMNLAYQYISWIVKEPIEGNYTFTGEKTFNSSNVNLGDSTASSSATYTGLTFYHGDNSLYTNTYELVANSSRYSNGSFSLTLIADEVGIADPIFVADLSSFDFHVDVVFNDNATFNLPINILNVIRGAADLVTIDDSLKVNEDLTVEGSFKAGASNTMVFDDDVIFSNDITVDGSISSAFGSVTIDDDLQVNQDLTITGALVAGNVTSNDFITAATNLNGEVVNIERIDIDTQTVSTLSNTELNTATNHVTGNLYIVKATDTGLVSLVHKTATSNYQYVNLTQLT